MLGPTILFIERRKKSLPLYSGESSTALVSCSVLTSREQSQSPPPPSPEVRGRTYNRHPITTTRRVGKIDIHSR